MLSSAPLCACLAKYHRQGVAIWRGFVSVAKLARKKIDVDMVFGEVLIMAVIAFFDSSVFNKLAVVSFFFLS